MLIGNSIKDALNREGFVVFDVDKTRVELEELASNFGLIVPGDKGDIIQELKAQDKGNGSYGSFTFKVGYGFFPWHTDTAYWERPARYLLLTSDSPSLCATIIRSFASLENSINDFTYLAERAVFMLDIPGKRRYLSPIIREGVSNSYKIDFNIYKPMNEEAKELFLLMQDELSKENKRVVWTGANVAVIDNWRVIHSREEAYIDKNRILKRMYINELV